MLNVDTTLGRMVEEEKKKREKFGKEIKEKREWWMMLEKG